MADDSNALSAQCPNDLFIYSGRDGATCQYFKDIFIPDGEGREGIRDDAKAFRPLCLVQVINSGTLCRYKWPNDVQIAKRGLCASCIDLDDRDKYQSSFKRTEKDFDSDTECHAGNVALDDM